MATSSTTTNDSTKGQPIVVATNPKGELKSALDAFETSLATPIVSGDMLGWIAEVQRAWADASAQIHFHMKQLHPRQFDEIAKQDPELLPRIELLTSEDEAIEHQREKINQLVTRVGQHIPKMEPDEEKAQKYTKTLLDEGVAFLTRVRKQAVGVQTWYVEAFNRDRGAVD